MPTLKVSENQLANFMLCDDKTPEASFQTEHTHTHTGKSKKCSY